MFGTLLGFIWFIIYSKTMGSTYKCMKDCMCVPADTCKDNHDSIAKIVWESHHLDNR